MTAGLAAGIVAAVAVACAAGAYFYSVHHFRTLMANERMTALAQGELMRAALEHQMMENDRTLIARMVESFGKEPRVSRVMLLDREGVARYSSAPLPEPTELDLRSPTCQACHRLPPAQRDSSQVLEMGEQTILRTVIPFRNRESCHRCHDPAHRINGVMIFDLDAGGIRAEVNRDLRWLVGGTGAVALLLIVLIAGVVRVFVLRRLQRFETTARLIAGGDLAQRIPAEGGDTVSWLAREFNSMADSVTGLVGEVRSERERLETVINSIDDGIVVLDPQRKIVAANDAFLQRTGTVRDEAVGCWCRDVTTSLCGSGDCPTLACLDSGRRQVRLCERRLPDGSVAWEEVHASPILGPDGKLLQVVEVWRDITDRRAAEARLAEAHRLGSLGQLASGFSHEMNTPLGTVLACVEGILREARGHPEKPEWEAIREGGTVARDQILRCRGITQHFLRMSRGQTSADIVDLEAAVRAVARLVEPTARDRGVRVDVGPLPPGLHARVDESELQHALVNLVLNAVQACQAGGTVTLAAERDDLLRLRITDDGCGIAPEQRKRIFEPFVSLRKGGIGLGLFLSQSFVRRWGGEIVVESEPGRGSTFEIRLPPVAASLAAGIAR
ncbi:MAG TPA: ATP-binding protein [Vicinamibacteria bacterium]|nr:ATP-binding protein [Vicinamibacteria bacterium]